jgi:hypothetical protein
MLSGLESTNEWEHVTVSLLSLAYLTQHKDLQFHPFSCKWQIFIFLYGWVIFHGGMCVCVCVCVCVCIYHCEQSWINMGVQVSVLFIDLHSCKYGSRVLRPFWTECCFVVGFLCLAILFLNYFIRIYLLYIGDSLWHLEIILPCTFVRSPHNLSPTTPSLLH